MSLNLKKPLIVFDLETTGLDLVKDRIIQLSYIKVFPDGKEERENLYINPEREIPHEVEELTGITNKDVTAAPTFKEKAADLADKFKGCDFAGFNSNRFDVPLLAEEFLRAGIDFTTRWNDAILLQLMSFIVGGRWKTTSRLIRPMRIRRLHGASCRDR